MGDTKKEDSNLVLPLTDIEEPRDEDVVFGRGGYSNNHPGNHQYLQLVKAHEVEYLGLSTRKEKTQMAMDMVQKLRNQGIRFLKKNDTTDQWDDVGDLKAREKISQRLRERAPLLKKELERLAGGGSAAVATNGSTNGVAINNNSPNNNNNNNNNNNINTMNGKVTLQQPQQQEPQLCLSSQNDIQMQQIQQQTQLLMQRQLQRQLLEVSLQNQALHAKAFHAQALMEQQLQMQQQQQHHQLNQSWQGTTTTNTGNLWMKQEQEQQQDDAKQQEQFVHRMSMSEPILNVPRQQYREEQSQATTVTDDTYPEDLPPLGNNVGVEPEQRNSMFSISSSTKSLLANIHWDDLLEEEEEEEDDNKGSNNIKQEPESPKPTLYKFGREEQDGQRTPTRSNNGGAVGVLPTVPFSEYANATATVTPTPSSPHRTDYAPTTNVLDSKALEAWANAPANSPLPIYVSNDESGRTVRRRNTTAQKAPARSAPYRKTLSGPARSQTTPPTEQNEYDPHVLMMKRPNSISKRSTSHQNEDSRRGFQANNDNDDDDNGRHAKSSFTSVKKASLSRDRSAQSRLLKEKYMPDIYGSSTSTMSTASMSEESARSSASSMFSALGMPNLTPMSQQQPRQVSDSQSEEAVEADIRNISADIMGGKPHRLSWRNRASTIEALDLNNLDDDPVLRSEQEGTLAQGMAEMWTTADESEETLDAIVLEVAQQQTWGNDNQGGL